MLSVMHACHYACVRLCARGCTFIRTKTYTCTLLPWLLAAVLPLAGGDGQDAQPRWLRQLGDGERQAATCMYPHSGTPTPAVLCSGCL